ncbi:MAG: protein kinase [Bryobacteraceae bacterium]
MALPASTRVGPYEILGLVGEGGMGEVYKARDTRLDRVVAVKFSSLQFSERFKHEARAIAALNHPNICQIYDVGPDYLVMEFVDGVRLHAVHGNRELLNLAVQLADGLSAAHAAGLVHRDLKPDNILLARDGRVKILDFGVVKHLLQAAAADETRSISATAPGRVVGTAAYMSPEQARGQEVDARSDQFSLGLILFELASGAHPFQRDNAAETMAAIIREEPPPLPSSVLAPLRWIVERCLAKNPADRYESTRDLYQELRALRDHFSEASTPAGTPPASDFTRRAWLAGAAGMAALTAGAGAGALWQRSRTAEPPLWSGLMLGGPGVALGPRISPDGQLLAFVAMVDDQTQVAVMKPDVGSWTVLTSQTDGGPVLNIAWSPDGSRLYFDRYWDKPRGVYMVPPLGGEPMLVLENAAAPLPLPDGSIVVLRSGSNLRDQMYRFWPVSGRLDPLPADVAFWRLTGALRAAPDGRTIVFLRASGPEETARSLALCALDVGSRQVRPLAPGFAFDYAESEVLAAAITPDGRSVLFGLRQDDTWRIISAPLGGGRGSRVLMSLPDSAALWHMDAARDGSLYIDQVTRGSSLLRFSLAGGQPSERAFYRLAVPSILPLDDGRILFTALHSGKPHLMVVRPGMEPRRFLPMNEESSAPMTRIATDAIAFLAGGAAHMRIAIASLREGRMLRQLPFDASEVRSLTASADGGTLYYAAGNVIWSVASDGSGTPKRLIDGNQVSADPGGRFLYVKQLAADPIRLLRVPLAGGDPWPVPTPAGLRLTIQDFAPAAVDSRGRLLLDTASRDSWFYRLSIVDPEHDIIKPLPLSFHGGLGSPCWTADGHITALGIGLASTLWWYRPSPG